MFKQVNSFLEKRMLFLTPTAVVIGIIGSSWLDTLAPLVPWIFAFITFVSSLGIKVRQLKKSLSHPLPILLSLVIIQFIMPLLALCIGNLLFTNDPYTVVGLIIAFIIPTGVISLMWVSIYKGDLSVTLLIVLINTLLSPILIPFSLQLLVGTSIELNTFQLMTSLFWMIVVPSLVGIVMNEVVFKSNEVVKVRLAPFAKISLLIVIAVNSSVAAPAFQFNSDLLKIMVIVFILASLGYVLGALFAKLIRSNDQVAISMLFNSGMRNISVGATIAILYFPPQVSVPIVIGTLFQQTLAAFSGKILTSFLQKRESS